MTAKAKIEKLTDTWYGYTLFANLVTLIANGIGFFSLLFSGMTTLFSLFLTFLVGRWLLSGSSLGRLVILVLCGIGTITGTLGALRFGTDFLSDPTLMALAHTIVLTAGVLVNVRSLRTLTDSSVKAFFRR